jgi:hypothetical protein
MERQLVLLEVAPDWKLDERTKEIGKKGVEAARAALRTARRHERTERDQRLRTTAA